MNDIQTPPAAAPRASRDGRPCPPWCQTDHDWRDGLLAAHAASAGDVILGGSDSYAASLIYIHLIQLTAAPAAVNLRGYQHGADHTQDPRATLPPGEAEGLAGLVAMLAGATPDQHRELAAAIRAAAAAVTGEAAP